MDVNQAVIICGGKATRLVDSGEMTPKSLIKIGNLSVLEHLIVALNSKGVTQILLLLGQYASEIVNYLQSKGVKFDFCVEENPLGTGGSLLNAVNKLDEAFFVIYGDLVLDTNLEDLRKSFSTHNADLCLMGRATDHLFDSDILVADENNRVIKYLRKPGSESTEFQNLANCGIYLFRRTVILEQKSLFLDKIPVDLDSEIIPKLVEKQARVYVVRSNGYVQDMGTPERLSRVRRDYSLGLVVNEPRPTAILDRDGVINRDIGHVRKVEDFIFLEGAIDAINLIQKKGYRIIVITNQPVLARGESTLSEILRMHAKLDHELAKTGSYISNYYVCPHYPEKGFQGEIIDLKVECSCRKPKISLYEKANSEFPILKEKSFAVGDRISDALAAKNFGLDFFALNGNFGSEKPYKYATHGNLLEVAHMVPDIFGGLLEHCDNH